MTEAEIERNRRLEVQAALIVAMQHWAEWVDECRGVRPWQVDGEQEAWNKCGEMADAWTNRARGGIGG